METKMSKYVKYISSDHFGSPELKGDRWGYCVELLRTCLVTGFNERTDLVKFEVLTPETVKYTLNVYIDNEKINSKQKEQSSSKVLRQRKTSGIHERTSGPQKRIVQPKTNRK